MLKQQCPSSFFLRVFLSLIMIIMPAIYGCGGGGSVESFNNNNESELQILSDHFFATTTTDSSGKAVLDTFSFNKDIELEVTDEQGHPLSEIAVEYEQNEGVATIAVYDPQAIYAPLIYAVDLINSDQWIVNNGGPAFVVVSGPILVVGCALALYTGYKAGDALYELTDFIIENVSEVDYTKTTIRCTVGELASQIPNVVTLANLPFAVSSNVAFVSTGGLSLGIKKLTVRKAITLNLIDTANESIMMHLIGYLSEMVGRQVGENELIEISIFHFAFLFYGSNGLISIDFVNTDDPVPPIEPPDPDPSQMSDFVGTWTGNLAFNSNYDNDTRPMRIELAIWNNQLEGVLINQSRPQDQNALVGYVQNGVFYFNMLVSQSDSNNPDCAGWDIGGTLRLDTEKTAMTFDAAGYVCGPGQITWGTLNGVMNQQ
ncbi:hypothetical protein [Desulfatitalea alkaliphila]|uniref:Uncharacterized protein n=1 Tax=Desulfatitalea alkaliphila TaxID=2929485 RepID=A0AA41R226_9BACT|nr:hypothetical protein [Desulfatitalea alkaliphila]MCJ8500223.1 hypothetical protein [Desulfatitalea alkaliphila]